MDILTREIQETKKDYSKQIDVDTNNSPQYSISAQDILEILKLGTHGRTIIYSSLINI